MVLPTYGSFSEKTWTLEWGGRHFVPSIRIFLTQISRLHRIAWADCNDFLHCFFV